MLMKGYMSGDIYPSFQYYRVFQTYIIYVNKE